MVQRQIELVRKSAGNTVTMGISRLPWIWVATYLLSVLNPCALGQGTQDFYPLYFNSEPSDIIVVPGNTVTFNCSVVSSIVPTIVWIHDGSLIRDSDPARTILDSGALQIHSAQVRDRGTYHCSVEVEQGDFFTSLNSRKGTLTLAHLRLDRSPSDTEAYDGDTVYFECVFGSAPPAEIRWMKNGQVLDLIEERISARYTLLPSGGLEIREVQSADAGLYSCQGTNPMIALPVTSPSVRLNINSGTNPNFMFIKEPGVIKAPKGQTVVLEAATNSPAKFTWFKEENEIFTVGADAHFSIVGQGSLKIREIVETDTGMYRVLATPINQGDPIEVSGRITALVPLQFNIKPRNTFVNVGSEVQLNCNAYGIPGPSIAWYKDGDELEQGDIYAILPGGSLTISLVIQEDAGFYQCVADNTKENIQASAQVIVLKKGVPIPTRSPETTVATTATPLLPPLITILLPDRPDTGPVPTKPLAVRAADIQAQSFRLSWIEPTALNGELEYYKIYLRNGGLDSFTAYDTEKFLNDLTEDTRYEVTIYAVNEFGEGESSDVLIVDTLPRGETLGMPTNVRGRPGEGSCTSLLLTWEPPIGAGGPGVVSGYRVFHADLSPGVATEQLWETQEQYYLITGLKPLTTYGMRVEATNENGHGLTSYNVEVMTLQCKPTGFPDNITLEVESTSSILVTWDLPPVGQRMGLIDGYKLKYRTIDNGKRTHNQLIEGTHKTYLLSDLLRNTGYEVRIAAYNINGTGPYSEWIQATTFDIEKNGTVIPKMPYGLRAVVTSPYSAVLSWMDEDYIGQQIPSSRYYTIKYKTDSPVSNKFMYVNATELSHIIDDLIPYTMYQFEVRASTGNRHSPFSLMSTNTTFEAAPSSVPRSLTIVQVENSSTVVGVNWQPPKFPNGIIIGYTLYYSTTDSPNESEWVVEFLPGDDLTKTLRGLTSDTLYYFKIRAHTSKGEGPISDVKEFTTPLALPVIVVPPVVEPGGTQGVTAAPPLANADAMGLPWWLWLIIILVVLFIIIFAILLLLCFVCGCCSFCSSCCPCCAALCEDACACCAPFCGPVAACIAACCPCCCDDEDDCAKCWLKFCCGAAGCVCCGSAYKDGKKAKGSANLVGYHAVPQNGKVMGSTPAPPDLWINHEGVELKKDGKKTTITMSPINAKAGERDKLEQGGGVDQQRDNIQETSFTQSSAQNQQDGFILADVEEQVQSSQRQSQYETPTLISAASHRSSLESAGAGSPRYASWGAKTNLKDRQQSSVNYNTTNIHMEDVRNNYTGTNDEFSTLRDNYQRGATNNASLGGQNFSTLDRSTMDRSTLDRSTLDRSTLDRQAAYNNNYSTDDQIVTFPASTAAGVQPFTITFEETTTSHSVEKSVPLPDGTSFKTSSNHQTFAKSYSTSDASQDQNLQTILQGGLENGPLAIEIPSATAANTLPAIGSVPRFRSASFNAIPQDNPYPMGQSPPPPTYNFTNSEIASGQTQSSGYASANTRGRASSIGGSSMDSGSFRRHGSDFYNSDHNSHPRKASPPMDIPSSTLPSIYTSDYTSLRQDESDTSYGFGRSATELFSGSGGGPGPAQPQAGYHTVDRSSGFTMDSAYGSPTNYSNDYGSNGGAGSLGKSGGGLTSSDSRYGSPYQSSAFKNTSESQSFSSYGNSNILSDGADSRFSYNNNNDSVTSSGGKQADKFPRKSNLLQSDDYQLGKLSDFMSSVRPLRRSMSVDNEVGLDNSRYWSTTSQSNLMSASSQNMDHGKTVETPRSSERGRSRLLDSGRRNTGISTRSQSLDRFGDREGFQWI